MSAWLAFVWTVFLIELTPGPNMTYLALLSARRGALAALAAVAGVTTGLACIGALAAAGAGPFVSATPWLYETLRWCGVGYLLWLAWEGWHAAGGQDEPAELASAGRLYRDGLITNLLNPKAFVFYVGVLPAFVSADAAMGPQVWQLTLIYLAIATLIHLTIVFAAERAFKLLANDHRRRQLGRWLSVGLAVVAIWLAWSTARRS